MEGKPNRRDFLMGSLAAVGAGAVAGGAGFRVSASTGQSKLVCISSANGISAITKAVEVMRSGGSTMDAVIAGVNIVEDDPNDNSVGYGGLPNEEGVVELDSSVMDGPAGNNAGAVACLHNIKNPSKVARLVMERSDHVLIVGEGALRFAKAHGFQEENLLTDKAREIWLHWKETLSDSDDWFPPEGGFALNVDDYYPSKRPTGTINCLAVNERGDISGVTTTSGLAFKIPGRVGDSPLIGAGLYVDNEIGGAGSTGRGEEAIKFCGSFHTVMQMALGKSPGEAALETIKRIARNYEMEFLKTFNIKFYALNKKGEYGAAALWGAPGNPASRFAVHDGTEARLMDTLYLFDLNKDR
jgi:N4-(beta-N-acetylglucosaminyl)-L-asparaginase